MFELLCRCFYKTTRLETTATRQLKCWSKSCILMLALNNLCKNVLLNEPKCCFLVNYAPTPSTFPERVTGCLKAPGFVKGSVLVLIELCFRWRLAQQITC